MESVLGAGGKPNCLVIDEIDGAPAVSLLTAWASSGLAQWPQLTAPRTFLKAAVGVLLSILNRKGPQEVEPAGPAVPSGGGRQRQTAGALMRPIICICNDQ